MRRARERSWRRQDGKTKKWGTTKREGMKVNVPDRSIHLAKKKPAKSRHRHLSTISMTRESFADKICHVSPQNYIYPFGKYIVKYILSRLRDLRNRPKTTCEILSENITLIKAQRETRRRSIYHAILALYFVGKEIFPSFCLQCYKTKYIKARLTIFS